MDDWTPPDLLDDSVPIDKYPMQTQMESAGDPNAVSSAGARGLKQLMPETASNPGFGITPVRDDSPAENMRVGNEYMDAMLKRYNDPYAASAAYNWGPGHVDKWLAAGGDHSQLPAETRKYANQLTPHLTMAQNTVQQDSWSPPDLIASDANNEFVSQETNSTSGWVPPDLTSKEEQRGEFNKGVHRSIASTANLMINAMPAFGKEAANELFGADYDNQENLKDFAKASEEIEKKYPAKVGSISEVKSPSDILPYLTGLAGENVAGFIPIAGEGYIGAKMMAPAMTGMAEKAAAKYMTKGLLEGEARQAAEKEIAAKAATMAVLGAMAPQAMAGEYVSLMQQGHNDAMGAALIGGLETGIYALPGMEIMNKVFGGRQGAEAATKATLDIIGTEAKAAEQAEARSKWANTFNQIKNSSAAKEMMKQAGYLGATGMASESIGVLGEGILGANPDILSAENFTRIVDSGIAMGVGGALIGGATGMLPKAREAVDLHNHKDANQEEGTKRTTLNTGEAVKATAPKPKTGEQLKADLVTPEGAPIDNVNPGTSNLVDPSILRPSQMSDEHHQLANKFGMTTEDLHFAVDHLKTDEEKVAALNELFRVLKPSEDPKQPEFSLDREARIQTLMKENPLLSEDRESASKMIDQADARFKAKRDLELKQEDAEIGKNGTVTRVVSGKKLKGKKALRQPVESKIGVHDNTKAQEAVTEVTRLSTPSTAPVGVLPRDLRAAKPRYANSKLEFPSDIEKAIYISGQNSKSKREVDYKNWLKSQGYTESDIAKHYKKIKDAIKESHNANDKQESIKVPSIEEMAKTQHNDLPVKGNMLSDIIQPIRIARNMSFIKIPESSRITLGHVAKELERITKEISGKSAKFLPVEKLIEDGFDGSVAGAQFAHIIMTAMPDHYASHPLVREGFIPTSLVETTYHENAHFLFNKIFTGAEKAIIRGEAEKLRPYFMKDGYLKKQDFDAFLASEAGIDELFANAVGKEGAKRFFKQSDQMKDVPFTLRTPIKKVIDWTDKARAMVRSIVGRQNLEDVMNSVFDGKYARDHIEDAMSEVKRARLSEIAAQAQRKNVEEESLATDEALKQAAAGSYNGLEKAEGGKRSFNGNRDTNPQAMGLTGKFLQSFRYLADKYDFVTPAYNLYKEGQERGQAYMQGISGHLNQGYNQLPKADRYMVSDIIDAVAKGDGKIRFDKEGNALIPYDSSSMKDLPFHKDLKDGDIIPLKDKELSKGIQSLQNAFKFSLDQKEKYWREYCAKSFEDLGLKESFSKSDIEAAKSKLDPEDSLYQRRLDTLDSISSDIDGLSRMRKYEYIPRQRYGQYAYAVKHRATKENIAKGIANQTIALHSIEDGYFGNQFDKNSISKAHGNVKKYVDRPDLYNVYDAKGRVTKDKLTGKARDLGTPFLLTHDKIKAHYGVNGDNLSVMAGLLNSRDIDLNKYNQLRDMLTTGINHDKFARMFKSSEGLEGYSKDWDRVIHSYATTASHFLGNMEFNRQLPEFQKIFGEVGENGLRERLQNHFGKPGERGYINSGSSDFGTLRAVNYLWCMGANPSSLLVESLKVPTVTLGNLCQFEANPLRNMATLGKYASRYYTALNKVMKSRSQFGGHLVTPLSNDEFLSHICGGDKEMAKFIKEKAANYNNIAEANSNRTFGGGDVFGTETGKSAFLSKTNRIQTLLSNPLSVVEQGNRLISFCANYEVMRELERSRPGKLDQLLSENQIYQDLRQRNPDWKPWEAGTMYAVDEENGAPGKIDRAPYLQGVGGAFVIPFFSFDHTALEGIVKMFNRGTDGKRALGTMLGAIALTAGIMGLPGARLLIKGGQALENSIEGTDYDWQQAIRENAAGVIGERPSLMLTNGLLRAYGGMEISQRISLPLPGEDLLMNLLGVESGKTSDVLGVEGSIIENAANAWRGYMNGQSTSATVGQMLPNSLSNISKAYQLTQRGAMNNVGGNATRAIPPDQLSKWSVISRALGMTSDQIASANEQIYSQKMKGKELQTADRRFNQRAEMALMMMQDAQRSGDRDEAMTWQKKLVEAVKDKAAFAAKHGVPLNTASFINQLRQSTVQRQMPLIPSTQALGGKKGIYNGSIGTYQYFTDLRKDK